MGVKTPTFRKEFSMGHLAHRLDTFKKRKWAYAEDEPCSPSAMAYAGFYAISAECAKCYYCHKEMVGWEAKDVPWEEHKSHCPECPFIMYYSSPPKEISVSEALKLEKERMLYGVKLDYMVITATLQKQHEELMSTNGKRYKKLPRTKK